MVQAPSLPTALLLIKASDLHPDRQLHFIFRPSVGCNVRQLEEKLILEVSVSPADSRSRLKDKLLITVQGARAGRRMLCGPQKAPGGSHWWLTWHGTGQHPDFRLPLSFAGGYKGLIPGE